MDHKFVIKEVCSYFSNLKSTIIASVPISYFFVDEWTVVLLWCIFFTVTLDFLLGMFVAIVLKVFTYWGMGRTVFIVVLYGFFIAFCYIFSFILKQSWILHTGIISLILRDVISNMEKMAILGISPAIYVLGLINKDYKNKFTGDKKIIEKFINKS